MSNERGLSTVDTAPAIDTNTLHALVVEGDLAKLSPDQQVNYYRTMCEATGLDYRTRPFAFIRLNGKLVLYALREATEQLRRRNGVSVEIIDRQVINEVYVVTARAQLPNGRTDASTGAVTIGNLKGEALANAYMKAETKAKRRVTLSICGLGMLDEAETIDVPGAEHIDMDEHGAPSVASMPTGTGPLHPLGRKRAAEVYRRLKQTTDYTEWDIGAWLQYHGFEGVGNLPDITEQQADAMARDAVAGRRPWQEAPTEAVFSDDELQEMASMTFAGDAEEPDGAA